MFPQHLILEAGNLLVNQPTIPTEEYDDRLKIATAQIELGNLLGYQAYNVGGNDFSLGKERLLHLQQVARFPFISANVADSVKGRLLFKPYVILKAGTKRFGVVGITSRGRYPISGMIIKEPLQALKNVVAQIRPQVDYVIVLAAVNSEDEKQLVDADLAVDFILIAGMYRYAQSLEVKNRSFIARAGTLGKYVGILTVEVNDAGKPIQDVSNIRAQLEYADKRLASYTQAAGGKPLAEYYRDRPNIYQLVQELQRLKEELQVRRQQIVNPLDFQLLPLDEQLSDAPDIRARLTTLYQSLKVVNPVPQ